MSDTDLLFTPAVKAAALIRAKKLSPVEYVDAVLKAADKANPRLNCFRVVMDGAGAARRQGGRRRGQQRRDAGPAARRAGQHQRPCRREGRADAARLGDLRGQPAGRGRRHPGQAPARGRRHHHRQGDDAGVRREGPDRRAVVRHHAQSLEPRAHAGRLERRRRGRRRGRAGPPVARHRRRGLGPRPGLVQRAWSA